VSTAEWDTWLAGLADAADRLEAQLSAGETLAFPDLAPPPAEARTSGLPQEHLARAARLLDRLERLERIAAAQHDALRAQLSAIAAPRPHPMAVPSYELGSFFDVAG
jgi:hypothetical protein